jgi:hypothetical protein
MIKNIHSRGRYIQVLGGNANNYVNAYSGAQGVGNIRFNTSNQTLEVFDGSNWIILNMPDATVGLNDEAESLLNWASVKRDEELKIAELSKKHPGVADAVQELKRANEQLQIMVNLVKEEV